MKISRSSFFKGLALGTLSMPLVLRGIMGRTDAQSNAGNSRISDKQYEWKMVTTWPPNFPILGEACQLFADRVEAMSAGRMKIRVYGGGELVPPLEVFNAVRFGSAEIGNGAAYYWAGKSPAAQFFASVPFGMNAQQLNAWLLGGGGLELWEELYADFNLVPVPGGNTGVQMGGWFRREINSLEDLKGLKMRMPGLGGKVLERAGGVPVLLAGGEIYMGLERGVLDATEWLGPFHDSLMGFPRIADYYYSPGWHECGTTLEYIFNKEKIESLPQDLQQILRTAAFEMNGWVLSRFEAENAKKLQEILQEGKVQLRSFPPEVIQQLRVYTQEVLNEITQKDAFSQKVYASYKSFQNAMVDYASITEQTYYNQIQLS